MAIHRKIRYWKLRSTELQLGEKTVLMGILNVTPDSFTDGGQYMDPDRAYARALQMEEEGADIIDIGAESTRPDSKRISADEEWQRLVPVLKKLRDKLSIPISIDTYKSEIAERAFDYGVEIVNDPSGLTFDPNIAKIAASVNAGLILNHMRGTPETWSRLGPIPDVTGTIVRELDAMANRARMAGVEKNRIALDPGLGFGKRKEQNSEVIAQLGRLVALEYPVVLGVSQKAFLMALAESEPGYATAAAVAAAILNGADIVRVHDVKSMRAVAAVADEIVRTDAASARAAELEADKAAAQPKPKRGNKQEWLEPERRGPMRAPLAKVEPVASEVPVAEKPAGEAAGLVDGEVAPVAASSDAPVEQAAAGIDGSAPETALTEPVTELPAVAATSGAAPVAGGDRPVPKVGKPLWDKPKYQNDGPPQRSYGDRPPYQQRDRPQGDRPQYGGDRPPRPQGDRPQYGGDRPRFGGDRPQYGGDRPRFGGDKPRYGGDRPQGDRPQYGGDRPPRPQGDRPQYGGDRPRFGGDRSGGEKPRYGGDRPQGDRPQFGGDRPPRPQGDRPSYGGGKPRFGGDRPGGDRPQYGDRPRFSGGDRPGGGDRPKFGGDRPSFGGGDRPPRRFDGDGPPRRSFGDRPQGDGPPRRFDGDRPGFKPGGYKPGGFGGGRPGGDRPAGGDRPSGGGDWKDRGPRPGGDSRPPRGDFGSRPPGGRPPFGGDKGRPPNRPFRKRP